MQRGRFISRHEVKMSTGGFSVDDFLDLSVNGIDIKKFITRQCACK